MKLYIILAIAFVANATALRPLLSSADGRDIAIDGKNVTIALTATAYFSKVIEDPFMDVMDVITGVMAPPTPEEDIDYFALIEDDVKFVVGEYLNQHNMDQIDAYKYDLADLLSRYSHAPVESTTYSDKNTVANSVSTAIVANRFLVEAVEDPYSMMLHYADIASMHLMVLQDVSETYTVEGETPSRWWVDLDGELAHYIEYGRLLQDTVVDWRNDLMECSFEECVSRILHAEDVGGEKSQPAEDRSGEKKDCYDVWTVVDQVAEKEDSCKELHGDTSCDDHCQAYQITMNREVAAYVDYYLGGPIREWEEMKVVSAEMAAMVEGGR